ncbi:hypothetical protein [Labedaea rhizosphaerae]|uniref:Uncharacterized protein n=1 Tax=Labedaea rhizosphaerae TaxID=598644 RepID=A0A4R6SLV0_LABRH|nr:hypothetical protein [Labedaea rhizosphaerae]TDQ04292.1 hypothetical protein EV186_101236 [Labedaea rhizosphaerae]
MSQQPLDANPQAMNLQAPPGKRGWYIGAGIAVVLIAAVVTVVLVLTSSNSYDLKGSITIFGSVQSAAMDGHCHGMDGYDDIDTGAQVNVYNRSGDLVATGELGAGKSVTGESLECTFPFTVPNVPSGTVQLEISHRGRSTVTEDEGRGGRLALTLK